MTNISISVDHREAVCRRCDDLITVAADAFPEDEVCEPCKRRDARRGNGITDAEIHVTDGEMERLNGQFVHTWVVQIKRGGRVVNARIYYHRIKAMEVAERLSNIYKLEEVY